MSAKTQLAPDEEWTNGVVVIDQDNASPPSAR
jgi:hypothetical protein